MNHDYAHCMDYSPDCPMECFRAKLERDLAEHPIRWRGMRHDNRSIKRSSRGSSKDGYEH